MQIRQGSNERRCNYLGRSWNRFVFYAPRSQQRSQYLQETGYSQQQRSYKQGRTERSPFGNQNGSVNFRYWVTDSLENAQPIYKVQNSFGWCKERPRRWIANRRIRDPFVRWCERRTPSVSSGGAVYSIVASYFSIMVKVQFHQYLHTISHLHILKNILIQNSNQGHIFRTQNLNTSKILDKLSAYSD